MGACELNTYGDAPKGEVLNAYAWQEVICIEGIRIERGIRIANIWVE